MKLRLMAAAVFAGLAGFAVTAAEAAPMVFMDQIGTAPSYFATQNAYVSQVFQAALSADDAAVVDDFSTPSAALLTKVFSVEDGFGAGFSTFSNVSGWDVEVYSSLAAASTSLVGDVYSKTFAPGAVTLTTPYGGDSTAALLNISTAIPIPAAGTYYIAVLANNNFNTNGEIGVFATSGANNSAPGGLNAYQSNPSGGFGFSTNPAPISLDAAYAVAGTTIPEPASGLLFGGTVAALSLARRKRSLLR